jgi:hypothetical protein
VRLLPLCGLATLAVALVGSPKAEAATTVCSAAWKLPNGTPGGTKSAIIQGTNPPCPPNPITATVTVGSDLNAGQLAESGATWNTDLGTNLFPPTSDSGIAIGSPAVAATDLSLTFDRPVTNPYFYASWFNGGESLTFSDPFALLQSNGVTLSGGSTVTGSGPDNARDPGFVAQFLGTYSQIDFKYTNTNSIAYSFAFTTGVTPAPGPLPILGVGAALSQARRLRRLSQQRGDRRSQVG